MSQLKLFCRHCWQEVPPRVSINGPHVQALCPRCGNWIKFLNKPERRRAGGKEDAHADA